jgi:hypothetical protein
MINLDMVGRLKDEKLTIGGIGTASEWKNLVENKNQETAKKVETIGEENLKVKKAVEENLTKNGFNASGS